MSSQPSNFRATVLRAAGQPLAVEESKYTAPGSGEMVVRVGAVSVNPADAMMQETGILVRAYPMRIGCDMAGTVVEVGPDVQDFSAGDRVLSLSCFTGGLDASKDKGDAYAAYQEYAVAVGSMTTKIPPSVSFEQACVVPACFATAASALLDPERLGVAMPPSKDGEGKTLVIWGGSSCVGGCATQLARNCGYEVIAIASAKNFAYCRDLGASHVLDYHEADIVGRTVQALKGKTLAGSLMAIRGDDILAQLADMVLQSSGSKRLCTVIPFDEAKLPDGIVGSSANCLDLGTFGERAFHDFLGPALQSGSFRCKPEPTVVGRGLDKIQQGLDTWKKGVSATKIVISI